MCLSQVLRGQFGDSPPRGSDVSGCLSRRANEQRRRTPYGIAVPWGWISTRIGCYIDTRMRHVTLCTALFAAAASLSATEPTELKDDAGKTIIKYVVEPPDGIAPAGTTDPAKQVGLILCFPEHDQAVDSDVFPVRQALTRLGLRNQYVLLSGGPQERKFGMNDMEPLEKLIAWAKKTYPINPRRVYMFGKGEGGKISAEFAIDRKSVV